MKRERSLRTHLLKLLDWEDAHAGFDAAIEGIPPKLRGVVPKGLPHSSWQLLEHLRRCQWDILDFCLNPDYVEVKSMAEYWPKTAAPPSPAAWKKSIAEVRRDRDALKKMAGDETRDLFATIPHGAGQTYLRELLLVADHNAYHVGQLVLVRQLLGIWK
jgi:DinB superfamily